MTTYNPWGLIAIFISFYIFYDHNRRKRLRHEERREELNNRRQEFLQKMLALRIRNLKICEINEDKLKNRKQKFLKAIFIREYQRKR